MPGLDILVVGLLCLQHVAEAQQPFQKTCVGDWEISFFRKEFFEVARKACINYGGHLVKVDSAAIQQAIEDALGPPNGDKYFIGGKRDADDNFRWISDGTLVGENGYENWKPGQPNNLGGRENCTGIGDHRQYQWTDVLCRFGQDKMRYICQRAINFTLIISSGGDALNCLSTIPDVSVKWTRNLKQISTTNKTGIYQIISTDKYKSVLMLENANNSVAENYTCVGETKCVTKQAIANGTPTIQKIENSKCNGSLYVTWKPNKVAVGLPHRITVKLGQNSDKFVIPKKDDSHTTDINKLAVDAEYTVEITACFAKESCNTGFRVEMTNKTDGVYGLISSAVLANDASGGCKVSWWPPGQDRSFTITTNCSIIESRGAQENRVTINKVGGLKGTIYRFHPSANRKCQVSVQVQECEEMSNALTADGFCVTPSKEPLHVEPPIIFGTLEGHSNLLMKLFTPSEENGLISCVFVIACYENCINKSFSIDDLNRANRSDLKDSDKGDEILLALEITRLTVATFQYFELDGGRVTHCNIFRDKQPKEPSNSNETFFGNNSISNGSMIFVVTVTTSEEKFLFKTSSLVSLSKETEGPGQEEATGSNSAWILSLVTGIAVGLVGIAIGVVSGMYIVRKNLRTTQTDSQNVGRNGENEIRMHRVLRVQDSGPYVNDLTTGPYEEMPPECHQDTGSYMNFNA